MRNRTKLFFACLMATAFMAGVVSSASAGHFSVDERGFRITWRELNLTDPIVRVGVHCPITMEGSFHSATIQKTPEALIGYVSRATVGNQACTGGHATVLQESLPWHVRYIGFTGALPNITRIRTSIAHPAFRLREVAIIGECLTSPEEVFGEIETGTREAGGAWKPDNVIPDATISYPCGALEGQFSGNGRATRLGSTTRILLRLI